MLCQSLHVPLGDRSCCFPAAVRTNCTIDRVLNFLRRTPQNAVGIIARGHEFPKLQIFVALLFPQHFDLYKVRDHLSIIRREAA